MGSGKERKIFGRILLPTVMAQDLLGNKDLGGRSEEGKPSTSVTCLILLIYASLF